MTCRWYRNPFEPLFVLGLMWVQIQDLKQRFRSVRSFYALGSHEFILSNLGLEICDLGYMEISLRSFDHVFVLILMLVEI